MSNSTIEEDPNFSHKVYKNDPLLFKSYVGMEVNVLTENDTTISGTVYTVDPVSESVILIQGSQQNQLKIIFGHAIKNIEVASDKPCYLPELFTNATVNIPQSALKERKNATIKLLRENRFSVEEADNILTIENVLSIKPPYEPSDCICENSIILGRIQNLLQRTQI